MKNRMRLVLCFGIILSLFSVVGLPNVAQAVGRGTQIYSAIEDKAVFQGVYKCYNDSKNIKKSLKIKDYGGWGYSMEYTDGHYTGIVQKGTKHEVALVTDTTSDKMFGSARYKLETGTLPCTELFLGNKTTFSGNNVDLLTAFGKKDVGGSATNEEKAEFLKNFGYTIKNGKDGSICYSVKLTRNGDKKQYEMNQICKKGSSLSVAGKPTLAPGGAMTQGQNAPIFKLTKDKTKVCLYTQSAWSGYDNGKGVISGVTDTKVGKCQAPGDKLNDAWLAQFANEQCKTVDYCADKSLFSAGGSESGSTGDATADRGTDNVKAALTAIRFLSGDDKYTSLNSIRTTRIEERVLYQQYLTTHFNVTVSCKDDFGTKEEELNWLDGRTIKKCHYDKSTVKSSSSDLVNGISLSGRYFKKNIVTLRKSKAEKKGTVENLIKAIKELPTDYTEAELAELEGLENSGREADVGDEGEGEGEVSTCASAGGAGSLGWIVCPVLEWLGDVSEGIYNEYVEPALQVSPKLFTEGDDATLKAWNTFRDIANVIFVIVLLIVIFSQLTGVGIDNYGIKKILPKLVVMAVLVNLSYALCILAVDVSNILGNGFQSMFNGMSQQLSSSVPQQYTITTDQGTSEPIDAGAITGLTGVGILGMIVVAGVAIWASPAILISLLVAAIGIAVSIFFLFILLSAREAAILVMVIMSPLAVVMYVLPNTKNLFDRWLKMFEGLLFVYPICGLLVGAGGYVSRLLIVTGATSGDFIWSFMAMVVSIVPIFFIPTVLKGAFSAMGKMGGTLAGLGASAAAGAKRYTRARGGEIATKVGGTDTYRGLRNGIAMHSLSSRRRARAASDATALAIEKEERRRLSDKDTMRARIDSARAAEVAKAREEAVGQRLSLMQSNGIMMDDEKDPRAFTVANAEARMRQLEKAAKKDELDKKQQSELAALARGMSGMKGGGGALGKVVRDAKGANGAGANENFMKAMGEIYAQDSAVKSKMDEKDAGAAAYTEQFMPNNGGGEGSFEDFKEATIPDPNDNSKKISQYQQIMNDRIKTHEAGLNQSGTAATEYLNRMSDEDVMKFASDSQRLNKLEDNSIRNALEQRADTIKAGKASSGGGTVTPKPSTGGSSILTGSAASDAFKSGRSSGEIHLPH